MLITTPDDRSLEVIDAGGDGLPCVFHSGTPGGPLLHEPAASAAAAAGLRWITFGRPGYGESTPQPGRTVASVAQDTAAVLSAMGLHAFVTYGWSGGGPHALACATLLPDWCRAVATIASVAPCEAAGLDFMAGMGEDNIEEFGLALKGRDALQPWLEAAAPAMRFVTGAQIADSLGGLIGDADRRALTGDFAEWLAKSFRVALHHGVDGWLADDLAFTQPWGFELADLRVPAAIWQGGQDLMVPFAHGEWLAAHVPGARARLLPEHGHLSLGVDHLPTILAELAADAA